MYRVLFGVGLVLLGCGADDPIDDDWPIEDPVTYYPAPDAGQAEDVAEDDAQAEDTPEPVEPLALYDTPCRPRETVCASLAPSGTWGYCWPSYTEPGRFAHNMHFYCTFPCDDWIYPVATMPGPAPDPIKTASYEQQCWAIGGRCERIKPGDGPETHCVPSN